MDDNNEEVTATTGDGGDDNEQQQQPSLSLESPPGKTRGMKLRSGRKKRRRSKETSGLTPDEKKSNETTTGNNTMTNKKNRRKLNNDVESESKEEDDDGDNDSEELKEDDDDSDEEMEEVATGKEEDDDDQEEEKEDEEKEEPPKKQTTTQKKSKRKRLEPIKKLKISSKRKADDLTKSTNKKRRKGNKVEEEKEEEIVSKLSTTSDTGTVSTSATDVAAAAVAANNNNNKKSPEEPSGSYQGINRLLFGAPPARQQQQQQKANNTVDDSILLDQPPPPKPERQQQQKSSAVVKSPLSSLQNSVMSLLKPQRSPVPAPPLGELLSQQREVRPIPPEEEDEEEAVKEQQEQEEASSKTTATSNIPTMHWLIILLFVQFIIYFVSIPVVSSTLVNIHEESSFYPYATSILNSCSYWQLVQVTHGYKNIIFGTTTATTTTVNNANINDTANATTTKTTTKCKKEKKKKQVIKKVYVKKNKTKTTTTTTKKKKKTTRRQQQPTDDDSTTIDPQKDETLSILENILDPNYIDYSATSEDDEMMMITDDDDFEVDDDALASIRKQIDILTKQCKNRSTVLDEWEITLNETEHVVNEYYTNFVKSMESIMSSDNEDNDNDDDDDEYSSLSTFSSILQQPEISNEILKSSLMKLQKHTNIPDVNTILLDDITIPLWDIIPTFKCEVPKGTDNDDNDNEGQKVEGKSSSLSSSVTNEDSPFTYETLREQEDYVKGLSIEAINTYKEDEDLVKSIRAWIQGELNMSLPIPDIPAIPEISSEILYDDDDDHDDDDDEEEDDDDDEDDEETPTMVGLKSDQLHSIIKNRLEIDKADQTGEIDYASIQSGAKVIYGSSSSSSSSSSSTNNSTNNYNNQQYQLPKCQTTPSLIDTLPLGNRLLATSKLRFYGYGPEAALTRTYPTSYALGQCWSFTGTTTAATTTATTERNNHHNSMCGKLSTLNVKLAKPIYITGIVIEHAPKQLTDTMTSALRTFRLIGYQDIHAAGKPYELGSFKYDIHASRALQEFPIDSNGAFPKFASVMLAIDNNYGSPYTCLYRFRVHGYS